MLNFLKRFIGIIFLRVGHIRQECIYSLYRSKYSICKSFKFNGDNIEFYGPGEIICKENSYIGSYSTVQAFQGTKVEIGKKCQISHNVRIYTNTLIADQDFSSTNKIEKNADVTIGDYVWVGANVFINPGVSIGSNSVVGANSVVTKNIPPNCIYGGVPAKLIKFKTWFP